MDHAIDQLASRYREAWLTSRRLRSGIHLQYTSGWPEMIYDEREQMRRADEKYPLPPPSEDDIDRLMECSRWLNVLVIEDRQLIWMRAALLPWREIARKTGLPRTSAQRHWHKTLLRVLVTISKEGVKGS